MHRIQYYNLHRKSVSYLNLDKTSTVRYGKKPNNCMIYIFTMITNTFKKLRIKYYEYIFPYNEGH